jgi:hypothetical protein
MINVDTRFADTIALADTNHAKWGAIPLCDVSRTIKLWTVWFLT